MSTSTLPVYLQNAVQCLLRKSNYRPHMLFESSAGYLIHSVYKKKVAELSKYYLFSTKLSPVQSDDNINIKGGNKITIEMEHLLKSFGIRKGY